MHEPSPDSLPPRPGPDDAGARSFRLLMACQIGPRRPPLRCFLPDLAGQPQPQPETTSP